MEDGRRQEVKSERSAAIVSAIIADKQKAEPDPSLDNAASSRQKGMGMSHGSDKCRIK